MIKTILIIFLILIAAIAFAFLIHQDAGYVFLSYHGWTLQTSIWIALLLLLLSILLLYVFLKIIFNALTIDLRIKRYLKKRNQEKSLNYLTQGYELAIQGYWAKAETRFIKATINSHMVVIGLLNAAKAAQAQHIYVRRDDYLNRAIAFDKEASLAIEIYRADLELEAKQWGQAIPLLEQLHENIPNHPRINLLLSQAYSHTQEWRQLSLLLPNLKKLESLTEEEFATIEEKTYIGLLHETSYIKDAEALWETLPKSQTRNPRVLVVYISKLIKFREPSKATALIERALKNNWDDRLVNFYGKIEGDTQERLKNAETWLKTHPQNPELLLCLGRLALKEQFWAKAKQYLETCLQLKNNREVNLELAHLYESLGDQPAAFDYYRRAAQMNQ